jgi:hypothetical protein
MDVLMRQYAPRTEATTTNLKQEANEYLQRAINMEKNQQYDEASILYKRIISLITSHEGTSSVDDELASIKRNTNQRLLQVALHQNRSNDSNGIYQNMVRQLSNQMSHTVEEQDMADMAEQVFEDPSAFQAIHQDNTHDESNASVLFQLDQGARLFYMAKDGSIQTRSDSLPLTVYQIR